MAKKKKEREKNFKPTIVNRKASHEYTFLQKLEAGIVLTGTEIKSIRDSKVTLGEAYCIFKGEELWLRDMHISPYSHGSIFNPDPKRERKLLLHKKELQKLKAKMEQGGLAVIPIKLFFTERNLVKLQIALGKGKKLFDKRHDLKEKDVTRNISRGNHDLF